MVGMIQMAVSTSTVPLHDCVEGVEWRGEVAADRNSANVSELRVIKLVEELAVKKEINAIVGCVGFVGWWWWASGKETVAEAWINAIWFDRPWKRHLSEAQGDTPVDSSDCLQASPERSSFIEESVSLLSDPPSGLWGVKKRQSGGGFLGGRSDCVLHAQLSHTHTRENFRTERIDPIAKLDLQQQQEQESR
ncbi:unnamed protein product [Calypogeia fissa]